MAIEFKHIEMVGRLAKDEEIKALPTSAWFFLFVTVRSMLCCIDN